MFVRHGDSVDPVKVVNRKNRDFSDLAMCWHCFQLSNGERQIFKPENLLLSSFVRHNKKFSYFLIHAIVRRAFLPFFKRFARKLPYVASKNAHLITNLAPFFGPYLSIIFLSFLLANPTPCIQVS